MSSAISFNLDQSKILSAGDGLRGHKTLQKGKGLIMLIIQIDFTRMFTK